MNNKLKKRVEEVWNDLSQVMSVIELHRRESDSIIEKSFWLDMFYEVDKVIDIMNDTLIDRDLATYDEDDNFIYNEAV